MSHRAFGTRCRCGVLCGVLLLFFSSGWRVAAQEASAPSGGGSDEGGLSQGQGSSGTLGGTYIDDAAPQTMFRLRYENANDDNRPDRAEFFYPQDQELRTNTQTYSAYFEWAPVTRWSVFVELPLVMQDPELGSNVTGLGDMNAGFKYAFVYTDATIATFQLRTYLPTGDANVNLGVGHTTLEPALLFHQQLGERLALFGEFRDWIPLTGYNEGAGNVLRYGLGCAWKAYENGNFWVAPVAEFVGWTVLSGSETVPAGNDTFEVQSARGDTIVNGKIGLRLGFGEHSQLGVSYGRALTGDVWYKDIVRVEYKLSF